jgi:hypothetical protein
MQPHERRMPVEGENPGSSTARQRPADIPCWLTQPRLRIRSWTRRGDLAPCPLPAQPSTLKTNPAASYWICSRPYIPMVFPAAYQIALLMHNPLLDNTMRDQDHLSMNQLATVGRAFARVVSSSSTLLERAGARLPLPAEASTIPLCLDHPSNRCKRPVGQKRRLRQRLHPPAHAISPRHPGTEIEFSGKTIRKQFEKILETRIFGRKLFGVPVWRKVGRQCLGMPLKIFE